MSECSDDSNAPEMPSLPAPKTDGAKPIAMSRLPAHVAADVDSAGSPLSSSAPDGNFLYDIDGKFAYSHYEKRPELYDLDGKHRYK